MAIRREDLIKLIKDVPDNKLDELAQVVKEMADSNKKPSEDSDFIAGMDYLFKNYDDTLDELKDL